MSDKTIIDLAVEISNAYDELAERLKERGYPRCRFEYFSGKRTTVFHETDLDPLLIGIAPSLYHIVAESDSGLRVEVYFPSRTVIGLILDWCSSLPLSPEVLLNPQYTIEGEYDDDDSTS